MNKENLQDIYNRFLEIKKGVSVDKNEGICFNLKYKFNPEYKTIDGIDYSHTLHPTLIDVADKWLSAQFKIWPKCHKFENGNKNTVYPVGGWDEYVEESGTIKLWTNIKRIELLKYIHKTVLGNTLNFPTVIVNIEKV